jgi:peptide/nickel transport system ATP-binding protein
VSLLEVSGLRTRFSTDEGVIEAVSGIDFAVDSGEIVSLVGETGSGKTAACESLTRLVPTAEIEGELLFDDRDLTTLSDRELRAVRGDRIAHVFQQPGEALDPVYTVGAQIREAIRIHRDVPESAARRRAISLLDQVGIPTPADRIDEYPHQLSGGMRQRVAIAIALAADPDLLVADEPTTALDVTIQAQVLDLLRELTAERDLGVLLVTHDLGIVAELADRVIVLYDGTVMERGCVGDVFDDPAHPYTRLLFRSLRGDSPDGIGRDAVRDGCRFRGACPHAIEACSGDQPSFYPVGDSHEVACIYYGPDRDPAVVRESVIYGKNGAGSKQDSGGGGIDDGAIGKDRTERAVDE